MTESNYRSPTTTAMLAMFAWCLLLVLALPASARDGAHPVSMWQLDGQANNIYLLGSVHLLRAADHPLPTVIQDAYRDSEVLVMEMDMSSIDPVEVQTLLLKVGMLQGETTLSEVMGNELYAQAETLAERADIPLRMLSKSKPWFAAITIEQLMLARIGFNAEFGIESHLASKAAADGKEVRGLETIQQQLEFLDNMSLQSQRQLLLQSLEESIDIESIMDELVEAWRYGDIAYLEDNMLSDIKEHEELYDTIVVKRNRDWLEQIAELLLDDVDYLVVVGALHLIGEDGLPALLAERGHSVMQLQQSGLALREQSR